MRRHSFLSWALGGFLAGALGWALGGLFGSFLPRTVLAAVATAVTFGLLALLPRTTILAGAVCALASAAGFALGAQFVSPLLAWPAAALVIGLFASLVLDRRRARVAAAIAAPFLGTAGFLAGVAVVILVGFGLNQGRVIAQFMWGGAAGFGLLMLAGLRIIAGWLDREPSAAEVNASPYVQTGTK